VPRERFKAVQGSAPQNVGENVMRSFLAGLAIFLLRSLSPAVPIRFLMTMCD